MGRFNPIDAAKDFSGFNLVSGLLSTPEQPVAPDYTGAAEKTAEGNLDMAKYTTDVNRPDMYNPWGSSTWTQGTDAEGNPTSDWTNTVNLSPEQQALFDQQQKTDLLQGDLAYKGLGATEDLFSTPYKTGLGELGDYSSQRGALVDAMMARTTEDVAQARDNKRSELIAQGIPVGSEAYDREMKRYDRRLTDAKQQSEINATNQISTMMRDDRSTRNQTVQEALLERQTPLNELSALRSGTAVSNPTFNSFSQQQQILGPDYLGAETARGNWDLAGWNADVAQNNAILGGLFGVGAAYAGK